MEESLESHVEAVRSLKHNRPLLYEALKDSVRHGVDISTDYSALGTAERCCILLD